MAGVEEREALRALIPAPQVFRDVLVAPTEALRQGGVMFRGGPVWPRYALQVRARHAKGLLGGLLSIPRDAAPRLRGDPVATYDAATWCGPVDHHFGHAVADFGARLAASGHADPDQPLLFTLPREPAPPPAFFWEMLAHLGIARERAILVREPVLVRALSVFPQAERRGGPGPDRRHLDLMDRLTGSPSGAARGRVYVSRARLPQNQPFPVGQIAGEAYLEGLFARHGYAVIHPEELDLRDQLARYRDAASIVFSEGSAVHGLQLLGRLDAEVVVIARRRGSRIAAEALRPRARSLTYLYALQGRAAGLRPSGRPDHVRGLAVLAPPRLLRGLARAGIDLTRDWDEAAYRAQRDADVAAWRAATLAAGFHPDAQAAIAQGLRRMGLA